MHHPQPVEIDGKSSTGSCGIFLEVLTLKRIYKYEVLPLFLPCWQSLEIHLARS